MTDGRAIGRPFQAATDYHDNASACLDGRNEKIVTLMSPEVGYTAGQVSEGMGGRLSRAAILAIYRRLRPGEPLTRGRPPKQR